VIFFGFLAVTLVVAVILATIVNRFSKRPSDDVHLLGRVIFIWLAVMAVSLGGLCAIVLAGFRYG
jgi:hypothetical protein